MMTMMTVMLMMMMMDLVWHHTYSGTGRRSASPSVAVQPMLITNALCILYFEFVFSILIVFFFTL